MIEEIEIYGDSQEKAAGMAKHDRLKLKLQPIAKLPIYAASLTAFSAAKRISSGVKGLAR